MDSIEQLSNKVLADSEKDLKDFCHAQQIQIQKLLNQVNDLKEENEHFKNLLKSNDSLVIAKATPEELICLEQIKVLKDGSDERELTYEEVKKFSELVKTLGLIRNKKPKDLDATKELNTKDLLSIVENE